MSYSRRWVFVLGMHRSGTSAVAGAIATSGICFGQTFIDLQGDVNEKGFWEHAELVAINEALLAELSAHWFDPFSIYARYAAGWQPSSALFQRMCDFLSHPEFGDAALCGLKDPRLSVLLPWWQQALRRVGHDVCYLLMNRQVGQVAHSLQRRDKMGILLGSLLWNEYTFCAEYYTRKSSRCWLDYEALIAEPAVAMAQVVDRLGLSVSVTTDFIDPAMQRQQGKPILSLCLPELLVELSQFIETHGMAVLEQDWQSLWQRSRQMNTTSQLWLSALVDDFLSLNREIKLSLSLGDQHAVALEIIRQRDHEIVVLDSRLVQEGALHGRALELIKQRDDELQALNAKLVDEGEQHGRAIELIKQRDDEIEKINATLHDIQMKI